MTLGPVAGLGRTTAGIALGGTTTQYTAAAEGSVWFPLDDSGQVARVDAATGEIQALVEVGDPSAVEYLQSDPHGVAAGEAGVWVANAGFEGTPDGGFADIPSWTVARIDQASGEATSYPAPALSVTWGADALWTVVPGRRGDSVVRLEVDR